MTEYHELKGIANRVAFKAESVKYGVCITIHHSGEVYSYVIWTVKDGKMISDMLLVSCTTEERLKAHVKGFIENLK